MKLWCLTSVLACGGSNLVCCKAFYFWILKTYILCFSAAYLNWCQQCLLSQPAKLWSRGEWGKQNINQQVCLVRKVLGLVQQDKVPRQAVELFLPKLRFEEEKDGQKKERERYIRELKWRKVCVEEVETERGSSKAKEWI